jgi:2-oxoacid:acceptor oxidoreductase delta subunit (pyruvate/2-ketoisovalerate family)
MIAVNATGCLEVFSTPFPETSWQIAWLHSLFGNAPAVASGVAAALKAAGRTDIRVVGQGGDGGTVDIGFACLSGLFERNDDVLYICYDNQAYMNTGVQRSGATPPAARTATTQAVGREPGNRFGQGKNVPLIAMAHEIPYADAPVAVRPKLETARRIGTFDEVTGGLDPSTALFEARRCMSCGNCFGCDNCYGVCPDNAIIKLGGGQYEIDYDYCKGCGLCAAECPCGAIQMTPEPT